MRRFRSKKSTQISMRQNLPSPSSSSSSSESENEEVGETTLGGSQQLNIIGETTSNVHSRESDTFDPQEMMNASKKQKPNKEQQPSLSPSPPNITQDTSFNIRPPFDDTPSPILPQNPLEEQQQVTSPPIDIPNRMEEEETIENLPNTNDNNVNNQNFNIPPPTNLPPPTAIEQREADDYYEKGTARKSTSGSRSRRLYRSSNANKNRASSSTTATTTTTTTTTTATRTATINNGTPRRTRNTYRYLDEIRKYQRSGDKLIPKAPFRRFIKHILCEVLKENYRIRVSAVDALHEAAESYLVSVLEDAYLCTLHAKRVTLMDRDIHLAIRLQSGKNRFV